MVLHLFHSYRENRISENKPNTFQNALQSFRYIFVLKDASGKWREYIGHVQKILQISILYFIPGYKILLIIPGIIITNMGSIFKYPDTREPALACTSVLADSDRCTITWYTEKWHICMKKCVHGLCEQSLFSHWYIEHKSILMIYGNIRLNRLWHFDLKELSS